MPKSRSNAIVLPSLEIDGHSTRPSLNEVIAFAPGTAAPGTAPCTAAPETLQMFCAPLRSDMKYSVLASPLHIGHASFAPPCVIGRYSVLRAIQISLSSRGLGPFPPPR